MCLAANDTGFQLSITVSVPVAVATDVPSKYISCLVHEVRATYVNMCQLVS